MELFALCAVSYVCLACVECYNHFKETSKLDVLGALFWVVCHENPEGL